MASPVIKNNYKKVDPSLKDLIDMVKKDIFISLNCHAVGTVKSFNPTNQTITATINYKKSYFVKKEGLKYDVEWKSYPILMDVPVVCMGGGGWSLTFPIAEGDECLILFNDRALDTWWSSGQVTQLPSSRLHSFSDGIAIVGVRSVPNALPNYDMTRAVLSSNGGAMVGVGDELIKIANETRNLNTLLQDLLTQLQALTVICSTPGNPSGVPVNSAALATIATQIGELLE